MGMWSCSAQGTYEACTVAVVAGQAHRQALLLRACFDVSCNILSQHHSSTAVGLGSVSCRLDTPDLVAGVVRKVARLAHG